MDSNRGSTQRERQPSNVAHGTNDIDRRQSLLLPRERNVRGNEPTDVHNNLQNYRRKLWILLVKRTNSILIYIF